MMDLSTIESRVLDITSKVCGVRRSDMHLGLRLIQDLHCDSLNAVELFMEIEDAFELDLPDDPADPVYKTVFTRNPFRLCDLAEMVHLRQGIAPVRKGKWRRKSGIPASGPERAEFTQLSGRATEQVSAASLFEWLGKNEAAASSYRRRSDGMVCVRLPSSDVIIGTSSAEGSPDEKPAHHAKLSSFLIDREPVSTTAYCRFLNSVGPVAESAWPEWFIPDACDKRIAHLQIHEVDGRWQPAAGLERKPMVMVSWHGANAYALWANGGKWHEYNSAEADAHLPTETQWEYAARGPEPRRFPWGDDDATPERMRFGAHRRGEIYQRDTLPMADVNERLGISPFGLHHMAGNVWQWCRDWYEPGFYATLDARSADPVNRTPGRVRSERGGSWIGSAELCRSSYRRSRAPAARGRCLGFRCVSQVPSM